MCPLLMSLPNTCGAAVRGRKYFCTFSMYPAVRAFYKEVPGFSTERFTRRFPRSVPTAISSLCAVQQVFLLVSVSFISSCACVGLLYRSSMCACVTFIRFVFREQKILQRMQEIVAKYEDHLRQMQSVLRLSYGRRLVCTDALNRMFITYLFCHHELAIQFLKDGGLIRCKVHT